MTNREQAGRDMGGAAGHPDDEAIRAVLTALKDAGILLDQQSRLSMSDMARVAVEAARPIIERRARATACRDKAWADARP